MAVERFKTQVLILHSETRVLDACREFFGDEYSVHLAQSGREALSTLGDTPIDFFVCAEDLPGMSGTEALREARKRSPNTQGILLAPINSSAAEVEALGSAEDFAAVLSGNATPEDIRTIVVEALRRDRMTKLQVSANDSTHPAANESGEHIVMSGDVAEPVPMPEAAEEQPFTDTQPDVARQTMPNAGQRVAAGGAAVEVLVLTQDESFFRAVSNATRSDHPLHIAPTLQEASDIISMGRVGVLVTDAAVAPSDVQIITSRLREVQPSLVAIVAGRRDDGDALMGLIADGIIYRFLLKPVSPGRARLAIEASVTKCIELREDPPELPSATPTTSRSTIMDFVLDENGEGGRGKLIGGGIAMLAGLAVGAYFLMSGNDDSATTVEVGETTQTAPANATAAPALADNTTGEAAPTTTLEDALTNPTTETIITTDVAETAEVTESQASDDQVDLVIAEIRRRAFKALADGRIAMPADDNALSLYATVLEANPGATGIREEFEQALAEAFLLTEDALLNGQLVTAAGLIGRIREVEPFQPRLPFLEAQLRKEQRRAIVGEARAAANSGDLEGALATLDRAQALSAVSDPAVVAAREELLASRDQREVTQLLELAGERLSSGRFVSPSEDNARFYYQAVLAREPENGAAKQGLSLVGAALLRDAEQAFRSGNLARAGSLADAARASSAPAADVRRLRASISEALAAAEAQAEAAAAVEQAEAEAAEQERLTAEAQASEEVEISADVADALPALQQADLVRRRYVQPVYPRAAIRNDRSGWVRFEFTVGTDGLVSEISVVESEPGTLFVNAATKALSQWEYQPYTENGLPVARRAEVRIQFALSE